MALIADVAPHRRGFELLLSNCPHLRVSPRWSSSLAGERHGRLQLAQLLAVELDDPAMKPLFALEGTTSPHVANRPNLDPNADRDLAGVLYNGLLISTWANKYAVIRL